MAKANNPNTFSYHFKLETERLEALGVFDPTLAIDTKLFVDPLLFESSRHSEFSIDAVEQYRKHFELVMKFLLLTEKEGDLPWISAENLLQFHELRGTCLGYGANSISGSAFGDELIARMMKIGKHIIDMGVKDPDLFPALGIFESNIGPDRISDMATNVAGRAIAKFNKRIISKLGLKSAKFDLNGIDAEFIRNPFQSRPTPIILLPVDILRKLPIVLDWDDVYDATYSTDSLRKRVNQHIGEIWALKSKRDKTKLREQALSNKEAFETLLAAMHAVPKIPYNTLIDPDGLVFWASKGLAYCGKFPITLKRTLIVNPDQLLELVKEIIAQFRQVIEQNGLNRELYGDGNNPRHESSAQRLFFAMAYGYCRTNDIDISPEIDTGSGKIDFKFSVGFNARILVEVKLSTSYKLISGYETQLEVYKAAQETLRAIYLVINVGGHNFTKRYERLLGLRNAAKKRSDPLSDLELVDGTIKPSASKRK